MPLRGRADLVKLLDERGPASLLAGAGACGYEWAPVEEPPLDEGDEQLEDTVDTSVAPPEDGERFEWAAEWEKQPRSPVPFWRAVRFASRDEKTGESGETKSTSSGGSLEGRSRADVEPEWRNKPTERLRFTPLAPWRELVNRLRGLAAHRRETREVDVRRLIERICHGEQLRRLPMEGRRTWGPEIHVLVDLHHRLTPFEADQRLVADQLQRCLPKTGLTCWIKPEGVDDLFENAGTGGAAAAFSQRPPQPGALVLALSDVGCLSADASADRRFWRDWGRRLTEQGCTTFALLPCPSWRWDAEQLNYWTPIPWERPRKLDATDEGPLTASDARVDWLLTLVAPAVRIEPELLRQVRLMLGENEADAGTEADVWTHAALRKRGRVAAQLGPEAAAALRERFTTEVPVELQRKILRAILQCHATLDPAVAFEELAGFPQAAAQAEAPDDVADASRWFEWFSRQLRSQQAEQGWSADLAYAAKIAARLPAATYQDSPIKESLQQIWGLTWGRNPSATPPPGFDPQNALTSESQPRRWRLSQIGDQLQLEPLPLDGVARQVRGSPLALLDARTPWVERIDPTAASSDETRWLRSSSGDSAPMRLPADQTRFAVRTDRDETWFELAEKPAWATAAGRDCFGLWAELTVPGRGKASPAVQRLRWIPPGRFLMGSPDDEPGRYDDESPQREVILTEGFWMFDTPVTQQLWEAVLGVGSNPSRFKDPMRPVEQVSHDDSLKFLDKLNRLHEKIGVGSFQLPTEAQWEYSCRAGTTTAIYTGPLEILGLNNGPALDAIAWYGGNCGVEFELTNGWELTGDVWKEMQYQRKTGGSHPVKRKSPNGWGLYDMLGNVWEWCANYYSSYDGEPIENPLGPSKGSRRVLRGGSWNAYARLVRSASRHALDPGIRNGRIGFRCVRVQAS